MKKILLQFDTDNIAGSFDRVVAIDADVDHLFSYDSISPDNVTGLVHGAIFTRGVSQLHNTAIFIGGSKVEPGEELMKAVQEAFFGPMRVSVMMDSNGCNTTAAAAVAHARLHTELEDAPAVVLGGTGPVGLRAARLLMSEGAKVTLVSRSEARAAAACETISADLSGPAPIPAAASSPDEFTEVCSEARIIVAAGAAGVCFLPEGSLARFRNLRVAVDLNAVPPVGLADIRSGDRGRQEGDALLFGALGVGGTKMKVHREAVRRLFRSNDCVMDTDRIYRIALEATDQA